jgi:hypothetical protein
MVLSFKSGLTFQTTYLPKIKIKPKLLKVAPTGIQDSHPEEDGLVLPVPTTHTPISKVCQYDNS